MSASVRVSTRVQVGPDVAFAAFTEHVDRWWRREPRFRFVDQGTLRFVPGPGGRLVEDGAGGERIVGEVRVWEPGNRLVLGWYPAGPHDDHTEVEVSFEPVGEETQVTVEHRGWQHVPAGHPARRGLTGTALVAMIANGWGDLLTSYRWALRIPPPR